MVTWSRSFSERRSWNGMRRAEAELGPCFEGIVEVWPLMTLTAILWQNTVSRFQTLSELWRSQVDFQHRRRLGCLGGEGL